VLNTIANAQAATKLAIARSSSVQAGILIEINRARI
jgi:hypothetical protein